MCDEIILKGKGIAKYRAKMESYLANLIKWEEQERAEAERVRLLQEAAELRTAEYEKEMALCYAEEQANPPSAGPTVFQIECRVCHSLFLSRNRNRVLCSCVCEEYLKNVQAENERIRAEQAKSEARYGKKRTCNRCKEDFTSVRGDVQFCSPACRQAAYRDRRLVTDNGRGDHRPLSVTEE